MNNMPLPNIKMGVPCPIRLLDTHGIDHPCIPILVTSRTTCAKREDLCRRQAQRLCGRGAV